MPGSPGTETVAALSLTAVHRLALLEAIEVALDVSGRRGPQSVSTRPEVFRELRDLVRASFSD